MRRLRPHVFADACLLLGKNLGFAHVR